MESMFKPEEMVAFLQLNTTALLDVVEILDALVGELNDRVAMFEEDRRVLESALRQL